MKSVAPPPGSPKPSIVLSGGPSAGGTVNLILSLDGQVQALDSPAPADEVTSEASEFLHRVRITELKVCYTAFTYAAACQASCIGTPDMAGSSPDLHVSTLYHC